jgi:hypothetical protein
MTSSVEDRTISSEPPTTTFRRISAPPAAKKPPALPRTRRTVVSPVVARTLRIPATRVARERSVRFRIGLTWALLVLNVLTFYPHTWSGQPLILPIPSIIGKAITQGALPGALVMAVFVNRRLIVKPTIFLALISLLVLEALVNALQVRHFGTIYRSFRLGGFIFALWLLSPWWGRKDLLLVRSHVITTTVVLSFTILGLIISPSRALGGGRLGGAFWPTPPPQVAEFAAVTLGLVVVMWLAARFSGWGTLFVTGIAVLILYLSHTRTAILAMVLGIFVAGLSMISSEARVRKLFASIGIIATIVAVTLSGVVLTWLTRGQGTQQLTELTGRTATWSAVINIPRNLFQTIFGFGLSNKSVNGLPVDSNWLASFLDQGVFGVVVSASALLFVLIAAYFQPRGVKRSLALFLATYCLVASFTETGFSDASTYLLELTLAASLLVPSGVMNRRQE